MIATLLGASPANPQSSGAAPTANDPNSNFSLLLSANVAMNTSFAAAGRTALATDTQNGEALLNSNKKDDAANAGAAAIAVAAPPQPPPAQPTNPATQAAAAGSGTASSAATGTSATAAAAAAASAPAQGKNGKPATAQLPLGAAELNARVVAGAPTFVSQPATALAGLWHHTGEAATSTAQAAGPTPAPGAAIATAANEAPATATSAVPTDTNAIPASHPDEGAALSASVVTDPANDTTTAPASGDNFAAALAPPLAPALPPIAAPVTSEIAAALPAALAPAGEQVAFNLKQAVKNGVDHIEIQLKPASLGAIDVKLNLTHDGRVTAVISADRSDTLNLLRQDANGLQQALRDAGLQADSGSLSFNLRGEGQHFAQGDGSPSRGGSGTNDSGEMLPAAPPPPNLRRHAGAVDIHV